MNIRLPNGTVIRGIPDGTPKADIKARAIAAGWISESEFPSSPDAPEQPGQYDDVPTDESLQAAPVQPRREPSVMDRVVGGAEAGLTLGSSATTGAVGSGIGFLEGLYKSVRRGKYGTQEGADIVENQSMKRAEQATYSPRTEEGQRDVGKLAKVGELMQALGPMQVPMTQGLRGVSAIARSKLKTPNFLRKREPTIQGGEIPPNDVAALIRAAAGSGRKGRRAKEQIAAMAEPDVKKVAAAEKLGVRGDLQPDFLSKNPQYREIVQLARKIPGSKSAGEAEIGLERVAKRADKIITEMGGTDDWSTLSADVRGKIERYQEGMDKVVENRFKKVNDAIEPTYEASTDNIAEYLNTRAKKLGGYKNLTPAERAIRSKMGISKKGNKKQPTYTYLDEVRRELTAARVKNQGLDVFKNADKYRLSLIEDALLEDQRVAAEAHGVLKEFNTARKATAMRKGFEKNLIELFGKKLDQNFVTKLATGVKKVAAGDETALKNIIKHIPKNQRSEVVASSLAVAFGKSGRSNTINFKTFADWYENASRNKNAFKVIADELPPESLSTLDALYEVSSGIRESNRKIITTGRGEALLHSIDNTETFITKLADLGKIGMSASAYEAGAQAAGVPGAGVVARIVQASLKKEKTRPSIAFDDLIASREFQAVIRDQLQYGRADPFAVRRLSRSRAFTKFAAEVGIEDPLKWLIINLVQDQQDQSEGQ